MRTLALDIFTQDQYGMPDVSAYGFHYKGWVVSPEVPVGAGEFTPPGYRYKSPSKNWIPGDEGGLLTTGTFTKVDEADDGNPFTLPLIEGIYNGGADTVMKWPNYPGEDFLDGNALSAATGGAVTSPVDLMPETVGNIGTVFITLEPDNLLDTTTNFPLLAFIGSLPSARSLIARPGFERPVQITMLNTTGTVPGSLLGGFPEIRVSVERR
jgi:hypothetical protein